MKKFVRNPNLFERFLLIIGIFVIIIGYGFISNAQKLNDPNYWTFLQTMFLWLILTVLVILLAVNENMKEELKLIAEEQLEQIKLLTQSERKAVDIEDEELKTLKHMRR